MKRAALISGILLGLAGPARAQVPAYVESMSDYEVRAMSGALAPANGRATIRSVTPAEWLDGGDPGNGLSGVIAAWSGGFKALGGTKLYVTGGGHHDSANNGLYVFDFAGTDRPTGWSLPSISPLSEVPANEDAAEEYGDHKPAAIHTYDALVYAQHNGMLYRFGGGLWSPGVFGKGAWKFDPANAQWTRLADVPADPFWSPKSIYDPVSHKILVGSGGQFSVAFFRTDDESWSAPQDANLFWDGNVGAYDTRRGRGIIAGAGNNRVVTVDWEAETLSVTALNGSGATEMLGAPGSCFYDAALDVYWLFGGELAGDTGDGSPGWTTIYSMNAATFALTAHPLTGVSLAPGDQRGSYGRFVFMAASRAIGVVTAVDGPSYVIKLPAGTPDTTVPAAPTGLQVR